jgi:hypothetical protein
MVTPAAFFDWERLVIFRADLSEVRNSEPSVAGRGLIITSSRDDAISESRRAASTAQHTLLTRMLECSLGS